MAERYPIPAKTIRTEITIKRSRFIATVGRAATVDAARQFIQAIRDEMPDANHHVYAFRVGYGSSVQEGLSDDGEPAGTSGKPVMAVLRGADVGDAVLVVTRYFGGVKLGAGGLVRAYSQAAKDVLSLLPRTEKITMLAVKVVLPYSQYEPCTRLLEEFEARIVEETFAKHVTLRLQVPAEYLESFSERVREFSLGNAAPTVEAS
ncbi:YigZ family protein [candidate division KSB3 bacterium]|uniref:YigZ family protein n=1 Tax=candidate division KSB3 bacterium TaxID=2044937 RepID=A0A9D5Q7J4_9BACT|nr:YigZ family protein [candidate division KSB3 bacterium]MBD3325966.1 YigZ family protein [candidate division KSB3 bacterium]